MNAQEMHLDYQEAVHLIRVGRFEESLEILKRLDAERPNVKNVLYPMAVCHEKLDQGEAALEVCNRLIEHYDHEEAKQIKARLELHTPYPEAVEVLEDESGETPTDEAAAEAASPENGAEETAQQAPARHRKPTWLVLLIALIAAAVVASVLYMFVLT